MSRLLKRGEKRRRVAALDTPGSGGDCIGMDRTQPAPTPKPPPAETSVSSLKLPPNCRLVTSEKAGRTMAIIGYPVATPRDASKPVSPPIPFPPDWVDETPAKSGGTTSIIGTAPPGKR